MQSKWRDFRDTFQVIFADSIALPLKRIIWAMDPEPQKVEFNMLLLEHFHKPYHDFLVDPQMIAEDIINGRLKIDQLDKEKHNYLFDFLAKSNALQNTCMAWSKFLEFYAQEEKDSSGSIVVSIF